MHPSVQEDKRPQRLITKSDAVYAALHSYMRSVAEGQAEGTSIQGKSMPTELAPPPVLRRVEGEPDCADGCNIQFTGKSVSKHAVH